uniref:PDGF_2 domain-containing protein n=1 Tax=Macrostomum lignano TaxID=282301 RepID=A0A1I8FP80_9PLAT
CPKSVTRVACIDDSRRVVTTTSWRLVRGACQRKARKREKKIANSRPCKRNGYRQVTFVSYRLRKCKCVRVQRKSNELCRCPKSHSESSCRSEAPGDQADSLPAAGHGQGKKRCAPADTVRNWSARPAARWDKRVKTTKCREDDFKRITTVRRVSKVIQEGLMHSDNVIKVLRTTYTLRATAA